MRQIVTWTLFIGLALQRNALAQGVREPNWGMNHGMMWGGSGWLGGIFMILFWVVILVGIVFAFRWLMKSSRGAGGRSAPDRESPLDILRKRYARGEITKEQYESLRHDIET